jgi:hypothetical protein
VKGDRLRDGLVQALLIARRDDELDAKLAGEILERWDELVTGAQEHDAELAKHRDHAHEVGFSEGYKAATRVDAEGAEGDAA